MHTGAFESPNKMQANRETTQSSQEQRHKTVSPWSCQKLQENTEQTQASQFTSRSESGPYSSSQIAGNQSWKWKFWQEQKRHKHTQLKLCDCRKNAENIKSRPKPPTTGPKRRSKPLLKQTNRTQMELPRSVGKQKTSSPSQGRHCRSETNKTHNWGYRSLQKRNRHAKLNLSNLKAELKQKIHTLTPLFKLSKCSKTERINNLAKNRHPRDVTKALNEIRKNKEQMTSISPISKPKWHRSWYKLKLSKLQNNTC